VQRLNDAFAHRSSAPLLVWPAGLRINQLRDHAGIYELTWSFAGPDGRATFEYVTIAGEVAIRWRRIGGHEIFSDP
jgi:hypothetical protein